MDPALGTVFLIKFDLADAYMHIWVRLVDIPSVAFLVPRGIGQIPASGIPPLDSHGLYGIANVLLFCNGDGERHVQ